MKEISPLETKERVLEGWLQLGGHACTTEDEKIKWIPVTSCGNQGAGVQKNHLHSLRICRKPKG